MVAEDQRLIRELLAGLLLREGYSIVAEAASGKEAIALARSTRPDMLLLDVALPDLDGIEVARVLHEERSELSILALSVHEEPYFVQRMLDAGAAGYVVKSAALTELLQAIRSVRRGQMYVSPAVTRHATRRNPAVSVLSARERQVLALIADGKQSAAIAAQLAISVGTVEVHRRNLMAKLGLHTIAELTKFAVREGLTSS